MGYDLFMLKRPKSIPEGMQLQDNNTPDYHRENYGSFARLLTAMLEHTDVLDVDTPEPEFKKWPDDTDEEREEELEDYLGDPDESELELTAEEQAIVDHNNANYGYRSNTANKVPLNKFGSNDGWHVVPEECQLIADAIEASQDEIIAYLIETNLSKEESEFWVTSWLNYNRLASKHGGYEVT